MRAAPREKLRTFRAALRGGVWQVTRDYVFHGDFETREAAIAGACAAAIACEAAGGSARVLVSPGEALISHRTLVK